MLDTLQPMFEIDFYLPRAFMACLNLEKFIDLKTRLLPPEVVIAGLFYFLDTERYLTDFQLQVIALLKKFITTPFTTFRLIRYFVAIFNLS